MIRWTGLAGVLAWAMVVSAPVARAGFDPGECGGEAEVRLDASGGSMEQVEVVNQDQFNSPASSVAAQLVDAYRFSHLKPGEKADALPRSSLEEAAFGAALEQGMTLQDGLYDTGMDESDVAAYLLKKGLCSRASVQGDAELMDDIQFVNRSYEAQDDLKEGGAEGNRKALELAGKACHLSVLDLSHTGLVQNGKVLLAALKAETGEREKDALKRFKSVCKDRIQVPGGDHVVVAGPPPRANPLHPEWLRDFVLKHLAGPHPVQPLAVGFCSNVIRKGGAGYRGFGPATEADKDYSTAEDCEEFSALVIGKRKVAGRCQLLVQNSWGPGCKDYAWECHGGKLWVDAEALLRNANDYTYLH